MQADEITKMLVQYTKAHRSPETALIPSSIPQGVLDVLLEDTKNQAAEAAIARPKAGKHITTAVLLLISQVQRSGSIAIEQEKLSQYIARYTHSWFTLRVCKDEA